MIHRYCDNLMIFYMGRILMKDTPQNLLTRNPGLNLEDIFVRTIREFPARTRGCFRGNV